MDPLRTGAVSIVGGRIVHFCSAACRETRLRGAGAHKHPEPVVGGDDGAGSAATTDSPLDREAVPAGPPPAQRLSGSRLAWRCTWPQLIEQGGLLLALGIAWWAPDDVLGGRLPLAAAAAAVLGALGLSVAGQRRFGAARILEAAAIPLSGAALLAAGVIGEEAGRAAICTTALLLAWRSGRLIETFGRIRSGVLEAVLDDETRVLAREWRDNSPSAERIRRVTIVLEWVRIPLAAGLATALWWLAGYPAERALVAGAILLVALEPRILRMITGDPHLGVALAWSRRGSVIRNAHAVERAGMARVALFIPHRCLLEPEMTLVDWLVAPGVDELRALAALGAVEADVSGRVATAVRVFLDERGVVAAPADDREVRPGRGVCGRGEAGRILCGSRTLMLDEVVSTAEHEDRAGEIERSGRRAVFLAVDDQVVAVLALEERPLPHVPEGMRQLAALGVEPAMISSAEAESAQALGLRLGIDDVRFDTPEERLDQVLAAFAESGDEVLLVGHGLSFEESFRGAAVAVCCGGEGPTMAGIRVGSGGLDEVVRVVRAARDAASSVDLNSVAAVAALLLGLALAGGWHYPESAPVACALAAAAGAFSTWNGPYPALARARQRAAGLWRRVRRLAGRRETPSG